MKREVALAVLERNGALLLQLRDDLKSILYPGHWGLFGGHLDVGETPSEAVHRELLEEINWKPASPLEHWFTSQNGPRIAHVFRGPLSVPVEQLTLLEGQDLKLTSKQELRQGSVWSDRRSEVRPIAPGLDQVIQRLLTD
jgi:8-oxo-dGTP diphosphatase